MEGLSRDLTEIEREGFGREHFMFLPDIITLATCEILKKEARCLVAEHDFYDEVEHIFSTVTHDQASDPYFLESGDKIRFFLEDGVVDENGKLSCAKELAINKIGHALHGLNPVFRSFSTHPHIIKLVKSLGYLKNPFLVQSMYIFKQPGHGGEVVWHQDATFLHGPEDKVVGLWLALDDATEENGCLHGIPGNYSGRPKMLFVKSPDGSHANFVTLDPTPFPHEKSIPLPAKAGSMVLFSGLFPHMSKRNISPVSRHAFTLHFVERSEKFLPSNWLQPFDETKAVQGG